jgi:hypothetical protein
MSSNPELKKEEWPLPSQNRNLNISRWNWATISTNKPLPNPSSQISSESFWFKKIDYSGTLPPIVYWIFKDSEMFIIYCFYQ